MAVRDPGDRRARRTRAVLTEAFLDLVVERPYDEIAIGDIIERADVGRSTFYQHFSNKEDLLRQSLLPAFEALSETLWRDRDPARLVFWADTIWTNRKVSRVLLAGPTRPLMTRALADQIAPRLPDARTLCVPAPLVAAGVAEAQLGMLNAWITGHSACAPQDTATALAATACGIVSALARPAA